MSYSSLSLTLLVTQETAFE